MKKLMWAALVLTLAAATSFAQNTPKADVGVGYAYLHATVSGTGFNFNGFSGSVAYNVTSVLGIAGDIGYYHNSTAGVGTNAESYTFGPRFSFRKNDRFTPYAQALFGGAHVSSSGASTNPFAFAFGGGTDIAIGSSGKVGLRPEVDYIGLRSNGVTTNTVRIGAGIVFHIGQK